MKIWDKQKLKNGLQWFFTSPMVVGFVITFGTAWLTVDYYKSAGRRGTGQSFATLIYTAHQKSVDFRLRVRGPRPVAPNLGLITVDERAVETIGRWPWPREVLAKAIDNAFKNGAKVLAFDMVFSEPQLNPVQVLEDRAEARGGLSPEFKDSLSKFKTELDSDKALGDAFTKYADKIVAGSFAVEKLNDSAPENEFCRDMIFKRTPEAKAWDKEEVLLAVNDPYQPYVPTALAEITKAILDMKEQAARDEFGPVKSRVDEVRLEAAIQNKLHETCEGLFSEFHEEFSQGWKEEILPKENPEVFKFATFDEWLADFRSKSYVNMVEAVDGWTMNTPTIAAGTKHTAQFNTELDADGTIRSKALTIRTGNSYFPALSLKAFLVANNMNAAPELVYNSAFDNKEIGDFKITSNETGDTVFRIPTDQRSRLMLNYAGPMQMYPYLSFADLVDDSPDAYVTQVRFDNDSKTWIPQTFQVKKAEFLKDKIFVVGATATGIYDLRVTPFQENYPGAETHLNAIDNIITQNFFRQFAREYAYMPIFLIALGLSLSVVLAYAGALAGMAVMLATLIGIYIVDSKFLFGQGIIVSIIWPIFLTISLYVSLTFYRYLTEERRKKELRQTFSKYVSPAIVDEILADPKNIELGGKKVNLTVMFSDVRGFTTISEKLDPRALSDLLNTYLTPMTEIVFKSQGTLDKYMGDAIMAFFGAPIGYKDHAKHACRCALQSVQQLFELQKEFERKGLPIIDLGIGLNTGDVSVGNMGSETVRSYTVMGDAVNLASRLEGINKEYGTRIILSEMTYKEVKDSFVCREVDWVRVKGKVLPVKIYELISEGPPPAPTQEMLKWFEQGYAHYHAKSWQAGLDAFSKALDVVPSDPVSKVYIERCREFISEPPERTGMAYL